MKKNHYKQSVGTPAGNKGDRYIIACLAKSNNRSKVYEEVIEDLMQLTEKIVKDCNVINKYKEDIEGIKIKLQKKDSII